MSAKPAKKSASPSIPSASAGPAMAAPGATTAPNPWLDSSDPRKRMWGKLIFVAVWIYVAALCLLALDQTFHWGIFGPKVPPTP